MSTVVSGKMRSDREPVPAGFTNEDADLAETMEASFRTAGHLARADAECQVYWPSPYPVCGAIRDKYNELGGPNGFLLWPKTNELTNPDGVGKRTEFDNGPIYWSPEGGAHPVVNHFLAAWGRHGYEAGHIGYPTTDEIANADGGRRQHFRGATIYWKFNEAYSVGGAIADEWGEHGWEQGWLGYPISDEIIAPDGVGRFNRFEHGVIYWSPSTGAHPVSGTILDQWASTGYERGPLGYPTEDPRTAEGTGSDQQFQQGRLYSSDVRMPVGSTGQSLSFGVPVAGRLGAGPVEGGVVFHGDGYDLGFRATSSTSAELWFDLLTTQAPHEFTLLLALPPGHTLQGRSNRVDVVTPGGAVVAAVAVPIAADANGSLVRVDTQLSGNAITFAFSPAAALPIRAVGDGATANIEKFLSLGEEQRATCLENWNDCRRAYSAQPKAESISSTEFPGTQGDNRADAARHCLWQGLTTEMANKDFALRIANAHEVDSPGSPEANAMDAYNNVTGRAVGLRNEENQPGITSTCLAYAHGARIVPNPVGLENENGNDLIILHD